MDGRSKRAPMYLEQVDRVSNATTPGHLDTLIKELTIDRIKKMPTQEEIDGDGFAASQGRADLEHV